MGRVSETIEEEDEEDENALTMPDNFRGRVEPTTAIFISSDEARGAWTLLNNAKDRNDPGEQML